ncbi:MAG: hypothetical protein F6K47_32250 [Symploca sp. SIO2E6]|nr:hypothetical protein [Symploca sp. SIO2E6]
MSQAVLTKPEVEIEPHYPQCYLYQPSEVFLERNLTSLQMALFIAGVDLGTAQQAAKIIVNLRPGFIISRSEYATIHQALGEIK